MTFTYMKFPAWTSGDARSTVSRATVALCSSDGVKRHALYSRKALYHNIALSFTLEIKIVNSPREKKVRQESGARVTLR
jgi:hypothetical protein